jgi:DNA-binding transcriptional LysR family regulator
MDQFSTLASFVRSAEAGSFAEAARQLGVSPAAVSKNVARLEGRVGTRLFQRSTRHLTLTEAGEQLLGEVSESLDTIQQAVMNLASTVESPKGTLKVSMGAGFGQHYVLPLLKEFLGRYPQISPDWHFDNRQVDLIGEGYDVAIGGGFDLPHGVVARPLTPSHRVLVAGPGWTAANRPIRTPADLETVTGILIRSPQTGRVRSWPLTHRGRKRQERLVLPATMTMSDSGAACQAAEQDLGVALVSMPYATPYLERGTLSRVLPDWYVDNGRISLYYREWRLVPVKTKVFIDFILEKFKELDLAKRFSAY